MLSGVFTSLTTFALLNIDFQDFSSLSFMLEQISPTPTAAAQALQRRTSPNLRVINTIQAYDTEGHQLRWSAASD
jgi:hypothetical protein